MAVVAAGVTVTVVGGLGAGRTAAICAAVAGTNGAVAGSLLGDGGTGGGACGGAGVLKTVAESGVG